MDKTGEEPLFAKTGAAGEDSFYDTIETSSTEFDNSVHNHQGPAQDPEERARLEEEWKADLARLEEEINTLRTVLSAKVNQASELKRNLGLTPMTEFKHDIKQGFQNIKESDAVRRTNESFSKLNDKITNSAAYQKTNSAFKSFGAFASKKFGDMRNSNTFKSFEEKVGGAYTNVKTKVTGSKSENNFGDLQSPSEDPSAENTATSAGQTSDPEKVPL